MSKVAVRGLIADVDGEPRLVGACCSQCPTHTFPAQPTCPRCGAAMDTVALPASGTVWSWTVQRLEPKPPYRGHAPFEPFAVAYIDLGVVRVESRLDGKPAASWQIGDHVRLVPGAADDSGDVWSYRFVSTEDGGPT